MTMYKVLHPRDYVGRLYVSRKEVERGLASIFESVDASIQRVEDYIDKHKRGVITAIQNDTDNAVTHRLTINKKLTWEEKRPYGRFKRLINDISHEKTWRWLSKGTLKEKQNLS